MIAADQLAGGIVDQVMTVVDEVQSFVESPSAKRVIEQVLPEYERQIRPYDPWLEQQGRRAVRLAYSKAVPALFPPPPAEGGSGGGRPSSPQWFERLYEPILDPLSRGAEAEATAIVKPLLFKAAIGLTVWTFLAFALGRWSAR
jgi:hypothetical protein